MVNFQLKLKYIRKSKASGQVGHFIKWDKKGWFVGIFFDVEDNEYTA